MTRLQLSGLILGIGLLAAIGLHLTSSPDLESRKPKPELIRGELVKFYLKHQAASADDKLLEDVLEKQWETASQELPLCEAVTLMYWLEGQEAKARKLIAAYPNKRSMQPLRYAMNLTEELPGNWEEQISEDWIGAKISTLVYRSRNNDAELANALIRVRFYENQHAHNRGIEVWLWTLNLIGMGLLMSMWFSARQWARLGERFFKLEPISIPLEVIFRFVGLFLLGFILIGMAFEQFFPNQDPSSMLHVPAYLLQMGWGILLLRHQVFVHSKTPITDVLGIQNMRMRIVNLFQIVGGLAIILFLIELGHILALLLRWPIGQSDFSERITSIFQNPLAGAVYLIMACVIAPIFEEIIFRALIQRGLQAHMKPSLALSLTAFFFCIVHPLEFWPHMFLVGLGLSLVYYRTANLMINIWAHAATNLLNILLALGGYF